jgi:PAS domain S-box-containing protein
MEPRQFTAHDIIECMTDGFVALDQHWCYTYVNTHAARLLGTTPEILIGKKYLDSFPEAQGTRFHQAFQQVMRERIALHIEEYFPPWERWFENHIYPTSDGISVFFHEITERKNAEQKFAENAALLAEAQHLAQLGSWKWTIETGKLTCSDELYSVFGRERSSPIDSFSCFMAQVRVEDRSRLEDTRKQAIADRKSWETEYHIVHPDGRHHFIHERGSILLDAQGDPDVLFGYAQTFPRSGKRRPSCTGNSNSQA